MAAQESAQPFRWHYGDFNDKAFKVHGRSLLALLVAFSASLFSFIVCLYLCWACYYRRRGVSPSPSCTSHPPGLDAETIAGFPVQLHQSKTGEEALCSICLGAFVEDEKVKVLPGCKHGFHLDCVDQWLKTHASCPLCRAPLVSPAVDPAAIV